MIDLTVHDDITKVADVLSEMLKITDVVLTLALRCPGRSRLRR